MYVEVEVALIFIVADLGRLETHHPIYQTSLKRFTVGGCNQKTPQNELLGRKIRPTSENFRCFA